MDGESAELRNQPGELAGYNLFSSHSALVEALAREGDPADREGLTALGARLGPPAAFGTLPRGLDFQALIERVFL